MPAGFFPSPSGPERGVVVVSGVQVGGDQPTGGWFIPATCLFSKSAKEGLCKGWGRGGSCTKCLCLSRRVFTWCFPTPLPGGQMLKRKRLEDSGRTSPGPVAGRRQGQNQDQNHGQVQAQDKVPSFRGVKPENGGFRAFVLHRNHTVDLGLHSSARAAARAYDRKVEVYSAEFFHS